MRLFDYKTRKYVPLNRKPKGTLLRQKKFMKENKLTSKLLNLLVNIGWLEKYVGDDSLLNAQYKWTCIERKRRVTKYNKELNDFLAAAPVDVIKYIHQHWWEVRHYMDIVSGMIRWD